MELSDRKKKILRAVVENYIQTAEPVGSKTIMETSGLKVSSATIRNEMAELESMGLLEQPHTSAGRIPSPLGYRIYVNELMEEHRLTMQETQSMNEALHLKIREMDQVMTEAGKVISQITRYPTFALTRGSAKVSISRFELLSIEQDSFIVVVLTNTQAARTKLLRLPEALSDLQLPLLNTLLNSSFTGKTLDEMPHEL
ncbi:MAG: Heat-inducible transcription repressor HrcA, partial [Firmicutes bacterium]|nr:Heat-inducible transcription repressor HrcA [Bacillota bacterium]